MTKSENIPPGWDYNPSSWPQRIPLVVIAVAGFLIALYLGLYQVGIFRTVWEPLFDDVQLLCLYSSMRGYITSCLVFVAFRQKSQSYSWQGNFH